MVENNATEVRRVTVGELLMALRKKGSYELIAGGLRGLERAIGKKSVQRLGVSLTGHVDHLDPQRVQIIGRSESGYLAQCDPEARLDILTTLVQTGFPAIFVTAGETPPEILCTLADERGFAIVATPSESTQAIDQIQEDLLRWLAVQEVLHGVLVDVYGVGVLMTGKSGIGKSEVGLELISKGHRLVADDSVILKRMSDRSVVGHSPELTRHHMEIRGLGIINIRHLFGVSSVRDRKRVELVIELMEWDEMPSVDRLGLQDEYMELAGVQVKHLRLPVRPGRSLTLIIEVAARNRLLAVQGIHSARDFAEKLSKHIAQNVEETFVSPDTGDGDDE
ncbi:MAG: HPr(Ser) kinase/phosphatase [Bradymonadia bacterium]